MQKMNGCDVEWKHKNSPDLIKKKKNSPALTGEKAVLV